MRLVSLIAGVAALAAVGSAVAQEKPTVSGYLNQGFEIIHVEGGGGQFLAFVLKKDKVVVHCNVLLQSGETSSCRTIK